MIFQHQILSAYLGKPKTNPRGRTSWQGFRTELVEVKRHNQHMGSRLIVALAIWCAGISALQNYMHHPDPAAPQLAEAVSGLAASVTTPPAATPAPLAIVKHARILPSGPSGQLLPPGTIAPDRTYQNSYARGQCTWYVASRRQIPSGWGNASAWYYHASASGWSVGAVPAVAAVAWTPSGRFGHVALVEEVSADGTSVRVSEMNYRGIGVKSSRWVATKSFKYIY